MISLVEVVTPNLEEAAGMLGADPGTAPDELAAGLLALGARVVVIKMGDRGAVAADQNGVEYYPAFEVAAVDTTAAGDAFTAALTLGLVGGKPLAAAVRGANAAGALAATRLGAQPSMPTRTELEKFLRR